MLRGKISDVSEVMTLMCVGLYEGLSILRKKLIPMRLGVKVQMIFKYVLKTDNSDVKRNPRGFIFCQTTDRVLTMSSII